MVATQPIDAPLRRIGQHALVQGSLPNPFGDVFLPSKWFARGFVFHELNAEQQTKPSNLAHVRMSLQRRQLPSKNLRGRRHSLKQRVRFDEIKNGVARSRSHRMRLVCKPVLKSAAALRKSLHNVRSRQYSAQRRISARDSLPNQNNVGPHVPVLHRERLSRAAHAAHDFVGDQKNAAPTATFSNASRVTRRCHRCPKRRPNHRLEDKRGHTLIIVLLQK